jgi:hypothetical protein
LDSRFALAVFPERKAGWLVAVAFHDGPCLPQGSFLGLSVNNPIGQERPPEKSFRFGKWRPNEEIDRAFHPARAMDDGRKVTPQVCSRCVD